jgi:hypothetical protein
MTAAIAVWSRRELVFDAVADELTSPKFILA